MYSRQHRALFVHIPKTAGQSIEHVFLDLEGLTWETRAPLLLRKNDDSDLGPPRLAHLTAQQYVRCGHLTQEEFDQSFKFAFVRNPWARTVSMYKYFGYDAHCSFPRFVAGPFRERWWDQRDFFVLPQSDYVRGSDGSSLVDFVGHFERLQQDFDVVCERLQLGSIQLAHRNRSRPDQFGKKAPEPRLQRLRTRWTRWRHARHRRYQDFFDRASRQFVDEIYGEDIERFGYDFEGG